MLIRLKDLRRPCLAQRRFPASPSVSCSPPCNKSNPNLSIALSCSPSQVIESSAVSHFVSLRAEVVGNNARDCRSFSFWSGDSLWQCLLVCHFSVAVHKYSHPNCHTICSVRDIHTIENAFPIFSHINPETEMLTMLPSNVLCRM